MATKTLVRPATVDDMAACARLIASYEGGEPADWQQPFSDHLNDPDGWVGVAVEDGGIIGYGRVQHQMGNPMQADPPLPDGYYLSASSSPRRTAVEASGRPCARHASPGWQAVLTMSDSLPTGTTQRLVRCTEMSAFARCRSSPRLGSPPAAASSGTG